jgi:hypothetical protein
MRADEVTNEGDVGVGDNPASVSQHVHGPSVAGSKVERKPECRFFSFALKMLR